MVEDMEVVSPNRLIQIREHAHHAAELFSHLPYVQLRKVQGDRLGIMRVWPKWFSLQPLLQHLEAPRDPKQHDPEEMRQYGSLVADEERPEDCWALLRWRPPVSYVAARWRALFSLATRYCLHVVRALNL